MSFEELMNKMKEKRSRSLKYTTKDLAALSDNDLYEAAFDRTEHKVENFNNYEDCLKLLNPAQLVFFSVWTLEMEVNNGGLCQFFVNSSYIFAPIVSKNMEIIGAFEHKKLYDDFIKKYNIDVTDLSFFDINDTSEFEEKVQAYPFDEYDEAFYELEPLESFLTKYVRAHPDDF